MEEVVRLMLRPKIERGGYHLDRFEAWVDDELIVTSRQPIYDGARELLARGYAGERLMVARHEGAESDTARGGEIGELAKWTVEESDRGGLRLRKWRPFRAGMVKGERSGVSAGGDTPEPDLEGASPG